MQPVDLTVVRAICAELQADWVPARFEQAYQRDRYTVAIALRTMQGRRWLDLAWHPQAARVCQAEPPPRGADGYSFSDQLRHQLGGLALSTVIMLEPWERVLDFQFARRPGEAPLWHLYVEIMGKYSNVVLTDARQQIVTAAYQVGSQRSSLRQVQTGQPYAPPPALTDTIPNADESFERWQERLALVPGQLKRQLLTNYRGVSPLLAEELAIAAELEPQTPTDRLELPQWEALFTAWQNWLQILTEAKFQPARRAGGGFSVLGWEASATPVESILKLLDRYYRDRLASTTFSQLHQQLQQKLASNLKKLQQKAEGFRDRLQQSDAADVHRQQADLLMAHLHLWQPGLKAMTLADFATGEPVKIRLNPEKNAVQNAQSFYKQHQKLKRARAAVEPLLASVNAEIDYLENSYLALERLEAYQSWDDLSTLTEIRDELIEQGYLPNPRNSSRPNSEETPPICHHSPSGYEILVGRNNNQNDRLSFRVAAEQDLWFHAQEIPGAHVLLRLEPGAAPDDRDLQVAADLAAFHSRARQSDAVPVVYTSPKHLYKPKGAKPGMVIYQKQTVLWGRPQAACELPSSEEA
ncbi:MAG: NFACT family protein [Cyanobacteria bacterium J06641_5]